MPDRCIAAGCGNTVDREKRISLHRFPSDPSLRAKWTQQVQRTRAHWKGPSATSCLCSTHFEESQFDSTVDLKEKMGFPQRQKRMLKYGAVPSIFQRTLNPQPPQTPKPRPGYLKRKRLQVSFSHLHLGFSKVSFIGRCPAIQGFAGFFAVY